MGFYLGVNCALAKLASALAEARPWHAAPAQPGCGACGMLTANGPEVHPVEKGGTLGLTLNDRPPLWLCFYLPCLSDASPCHASRAQALQDSCTAGAARVCNRKGLGWRPGRKPGQLHCRWQVHPRCWGERHKQAGGR